MGSNSILSSVAEAVYDFAHIHSRDKTTSSASAPAETQLAWLVEENLIILHRFGGAAIYRTEKVRKNTINGKKGTVKVTAAQRGKFTEGTRNCPENETGNTKKFTLFNQPKNSFGLRRKLRRVSTFQ